MIESGDLVRVRVVGLAAYRRQFHDELAIVLETHSKRGKPLKRWRVLWRDTVVELDPGVLVPVDASVQPT
jgi:hypothetical protein